MMNQLLRRVKAYYLLGENLISDKSLVAGIQELEDIIKSIKPIERTGRKDYADPNGIIWFDEYYKERLMRNHHTAFVKDSYFRNSLLFNNSTIVRKNKRFTLDDMEILKFFVKRFMSIELDKVFFR